MIPTTGEAQSVRGSAGGASRARCSHVSEHEADEAEAVPNTGGRDEMRGCEQQQQPAARK